MKTEEEGSVYPPQIEFLRLNGYEHTSVSLSLTLLSDKLNMAHGGVFYLVSWRKDMQY